MAPETDSADKISPWDLWRGEPGGRWRERGAELLALLPDGELKELVAIVIEEAVAAGAMAQARHKELQLLLASLMYLRPGNEEDDDPRMVRAPLVRRQRGEIMVEERVVTADGPEGRVKGITKGDAVALPLRTLHRRQQLSLRQYDAGRRLRDAYELAHASPVGVCDPTRVAGGGSSRERVMLTAAETITAAKRELVQGLGHVGPSGAHILTAVVLFDRQPRSWAESLERPPEDGMGVLRAALSDLADWYGLDK